MRVLNRYDPFIIAGSVPKSTIHASGRCRGNNAVIRILFPADYSSSLICSRTSIEIKCVHFVFRIEHICDIFLKYFLLLKPGIHFRSFCPLLQEFAQKRGEPLCPLFVHMSHITIILVSRSIEILREQTIKIIKIIAC